MSDSIDESLPNLEIKLGKMIDKLIETDEDLEKHGESSFYFRDEQCESKYKKLFERDFPSNNINNSQFIINNDNYENLNETFHTPPRNALININQNKNNFFQNNLINISTILYNNNNNYPQNFNNQIFPQQINNSHNISNISNLFNHSSFVGLNNSYMNMNTTSSSSSTQEKTYENNINTNVNKSHIYQNPNINPHINNSFCLENENYFFLKNNQLDNNTFNAGKQNIFNNQNNNFYKLNQKNGNLFITNVELEILLIQVKKNMNKTQKIDALVYNKCKNKFEQIIRTHKGSRIFQNYLKNSHHDILHLIFTEIKNNLPELLKDSYANYFCKKLFKNLSQKDRIEYLTLIQNDLHILSTDSTATYPIQYIIEELGSNVEKKILYQGIKNSIDNFGYHVYGARILEKILSYFEEEFQKDIINYICNNFIELAYNANGICLVKKILLMTHKKDLHKRLKNLIHDNALNLIVHQYGNYAIQTILENWDDSDLIDILEIYKTRYISLSTQKFSSNAIERILEKNKKHVEDYTNEICKGDNMIEILKNKYGNFVLKKAFILSNDELKKKLKDKIHENIKHLDNIKIINKWKNIVG